MAPIKCTVDSSTLRTSTLLVAQTSSPLGWLPEFDVLPLLFPPSSQNRAAISVGASLFIRIAAGHREPLRCDFPDACASARHRDAWTVVRSPSSPSARSNRFSSWSIDDGDNCSITMVRRLIVSHRVVRFRDNPARVTRQDYRSARNVTGNLGTKRFRDFRPKRALVPRSLAAYRHLSIRSV